jgi:hypothetical protein
MAEEGYGGNVLVEVLVQQEVEDLTLSQSSDVR